MKNIFYEEGPTWLVTFIAYAMAFVFLFVLSYLSYSFIKWDLNLFNWTEQERALIVALPTGVLVWRSQQ